MPSICTAVAAGVSIALQFVTQNGGASGPGGSPGTGVQVLQTLCQERLPSIECRLSQKIIFDIGIYHCIFSLISFLHSV